jgi:hypothetical protein
MLCWKYSNLVRSAGISDYSMGVICLLMSWWPYLQPVQRESCSVGAAVKLLACDIPFINY